MRISPLHLILLTTCLALSLAGKSAVRTHAGAPPVPSRLYLSLMERGLPLHDYQALASSSADGDSEIYTLRGNGEALARLTDNEIADEQPQWSPDGSQILWVRYSGLFPNTDFDDLWIMESSGENARPLTTHSGLERGSWSPDGTRIFYYNREATGDLYTAFTLYSATPSGNATEIISQTYLSAYQWSPDGRHLLLVLVRRTGTSIVNDLYTVAADGSALRLIAQDVRTASWAPQGDWLAFDAFRNGDENVYLVRPDGSDSSALTDNALLDRFAGWIDGGAKILLKRTESDWGLGRYYLVTIEGKEIEPFIPGNPDDNYVNIEGIAPDGRSVVYSATTNQGYFYLYWQATDSTAAALISPANCAAACGVRDVTWSSDGSSVAYAFWQQPLPRIYNSQVYLVTVDDDPDFRLLHDSALNPHWLPDAHYLALDAAPSEGDASVRVPHIASSRSAAITRIPFIEESDFTTVAWRYAP